VDLPSCDARFCAFSEAIPAVYFRERSLK